MAEGFPIPQKNELRQKKKWLEFENVLCKISTEEREMNTENSFLSAPFFFRTLFEWSRWW